VSLKKQGVGVAVAVAVAVAAVACLFVGDTLEVVTFIVVVCGWLVLKNVPEGLEVIHFTSYNFIAGPPGIPHHSLRKQDWTRKRTRLLPAPVEFLLGDIGEGGDSCLLFSRCNFFCSSSILIHVITERKCTL
jgi:hypothetical protein